MRSSDAAIRSVHIVPPAPSLGPKCAECGHARRIVTDGLTGKTSTTCDECVRRSEARGSREAYDRGAIARVAVLFGITVEQLRERLGKVPVARGPRAAVARSFTRFCQSCGSQFTATVIGGRPPGYCEPCRPETYRKINERRASRRAPTEAA